MGGNVFTKTHEVVRLEKDQYLQYCKKFSDYLYTNNIHTFHMVRAVEEKSSFGDLDIILSVNSKSKKYVDHFITNVLPTAFPFSRNGNVISILYDKFQIDIILVDSSIYNYACNYFNWNDLGNLLGRTIKQVGFKHGWDGLWYVQRHKDRVLKTHLLSTSYSDVLKVLKISDKYSMLSGFKTFEQLFEFVISSPYFHPDIFKLENLNHINKVRDRKRKTYQKFLEYTKTLKDYPERIKLSEEEKLEYVCSYFPHLRKEVEKVQEIELKKDTVKIKYNGTIVSNITKLQGKDLGQFMSYFSKSYYSDTLFLMSPEDIIEKIKLTFEKYNDHHSH